jgi:hypothetical protein
VDSKLSELGSSLSFHAESHPKEAQPHTAATREGRDPPRPRGVSLEQHPQPRHYLPAEGACRRLLTYRTVTRLHLLEFVVLVALFAVPQAIASPGSSVPTSKAAKSQFRQGAMVPRSVLMLQQQLRGGRPFPATTQRLSASICPYACTIQTLLAGPGMLVSVRDNNMYGLTFELHLGAPCWSFWWLTALCTLMGQSCKRSRLTSSRPVLFSPCPCIHLSPHTLQLAWFFSRSLAHVEDFFYIHTPIARWRDRHRRHDGVKEASAVALPGQC